MKLYLKDQNKYVNVSFWSILKAHITASLFILLIVYGGLFLLGAILLILGD